MEQENLVTEVEVLVNGIPHTAIYFVEQDVIHAVINKKTYLSPIGPAGADETVKALLTAMVLEQDRKVNVARGWQRTLRKP